MICRPLWSADEAAQATGGESTADWAATGVSIDSRSLQPGDLFIALEGPSFDGHNFIGAAFEAGAAAVMAHRRPTGPTHAGPLLLVEDTLAALKALGVAGRARSQARFIGVTGSVGKTGTKEALKHCLSVQAPTYASVGSLNNHWGVPLSLARVPRKALYGVFEMGMNHPGEIRELTALVRPHVALITAVEAAHSEFFASVTEIAEAKAEIFEGVVPGGAAVLQREHPFFGLLSAHAHAANIERIVSFGRHPEADARLINCSLLGGHSTVRALINGTLLDFCIGLPGAHWVMNSLAVLATIHAAGADIRAAVAELATLKPLKGRGMRQVLPLPGGSFELIDDSYNANPASMRAAFAVLQQTTLGPGGRRVAVLGDMLELGSGSETLHAKLAEPIEAAGIDLVYTCGPHMAALHDALPKGRRGGHAADAQKLAPLVAAGLRPGDTVLVKGSQGSRMALVIEALAAIETEPPRAANGR
ncbi:MAG: UDP-N-acetylmuramoylalanyl-D-glutamyl-2,6-diaminopimelate--D-alanyl-D-alanine ligase [Rhodospirillales bacterium]|nr:UDP-N-acetylmuramoylalanyl-D-glutamyl-2,6-diaminopimelate--D-alanyl-D-alanine ligase [Rhodospirillales bacterium]